MLLVVTVLVACGPVEPVEPRLDRLGLAVEAADGESLPHELLRMRDADQGLRRTQAAGEAQATVDEVVARVDAHHARRLGEILDMVGWPGVDLVGAAAADAAWLLAQHADGDPALQRRALDLLRREVEEGHAPARHLAYLEDRVAWHEGRPQRFGTQGSCAAPGTWTPFPIEGADEVVDARRSEVGLEPEAAYVAGMGAQCR
jgi:hypothetical protein